MRFYSHFNIRFIQYTSIHIFSLVPKSYNCNKFFQRKISDSKLQMKYMNQRNLVGALQQRAMAQGFLPKYELVRVSQSISCDCISPMNVIV